MTVDRWIVIPNWREFQHYKDRDPKWIKVYTRLLNDDAYLQLTYRHRGILHSLWLLYAAADGVLRWSEVGQKLAGSGTKQGEKSVGSRDLDALNHAGFIDIVASKPLALRYQAASPEVEKEKKDLSTSKERARANGTPATQTGKRVCPVCTVECRNQDVLAEHLDNVHWLNPEQITRALQDATP